MCDMTHSCVCVRTRGSICILKHHHGCLYLGRDASMCVTWHVHTCVCAYGSLAIFWSTTESCHIYKQWSYHTYEWVVSHIYTYFDLPVVSTCDATHSYVWYDSAYVCVWGGVYIYFWPPPRLFTCVTWLNHLRDIAHSCVCVLRVCAGSRCTFNHTTVVYMSDVMHSYMWHDSFICLCVRTGV